MRRARAGNTDEPSIRAETGAVLSPKGKSQTHTNRATHALGLRIVNLGEGKELEERERQVCIFWAARVILVRLCSQR